MSIAFEHDALVEVAPEIWSMMLSLELDPTDDAPEELFPPGSATTTGLVTLSGEWTGAIAVQCSVAAARRFAAAMFLADDPETMEPDEVNDAMAELTNMTGGNIKNLLPAAAKLGIPSVTEGTGYTLRIPRALPVHKLVYDCNGDPVLVTVYEHGLI